MSEHIYSLEQEIIRKNQIIKDKLEQEKLEIANQIKNKENN
ncbi:hypothetical protein [Spiroplasma endosymbiont of Tricholauxania praeusta]